MTREAYYNSNKRSMDRLAHIEPSVKEDGRTMYDICRGRPAQKNVSNEKKKRINVV